MIKNGGCATLARFVFLYHFITIAALCQPERVKKPCIARKITSFAELAYSANKHERGQKMLMKNILTNATACAILISQNTLSWEI